MVERGRDLVEFDVPVVAKDSYVTVRKEILCVECVGRDGKGNVKIEFVEDGDRGVVASWKFCSFGEEFRVVGSDGGSDC